MESEGTNYTISKIVYTNLYMRMEHYYCWPKSRLGPRIVGVN